MTFAEYFRKHLRKLDHLTYNTHRQYIAIYNEYVNFCKEHGDLDLKVNDLYLAKQKQRALKNCNNHWNSYVDMLKKNNYKHTSIRQIISKFKAVNKAIEQTEGIKLHFPEIKLNAPTKPVWCWTPEFTESFLKWKPDTKQREVTAMKIQILTCSRPSDLLKMNFKSFSQKDGEHYIQTISEKTNFIVRSLIPENIWKEAYFYVDNYFNLLPYSNYDNYYDDVKEITKMVAGNLPTEVFDVDKNGKIFTRESTIYNETTPHSLRKAGINLLLHWGIDEKTIMDNYSGHRNSRVFEEYYVGASNKRSMDIIKSKKL